MILHEMSFLGPSRVEVRLTEDLSYTLDFSGLVIYQNGRKTIRGKTFPYAFRSVEQLRYDFERDVAAIGGRLGPDT